MYFGDEKRDLGIVGDPNSFRTRSANHEAAKAECTYGDTGRGCKQIKLRRGRERERETETETERQSAKQREQER